MMRYIEDLLFLFLSGSQERKEKDEYKQCPRFLCRNDRNVCRNLCVPCWIRV